MRVRGSGISQGDMAIARYRKLDALREEGGVRTPERQVVRETGETMECPMARLLDKLQRAMR